MTIDSRKQLLKTIKQRKYLNKDFDGFKTDLLDYARLYYSDKIRDFSDSSLGGLFLDLASYVGDVQSFYLDFQFHELNAETAVETKNIERLLREAGVKIVGSSPATVNATFLVEIPADTTLSPRIPDATSLPVIRAGTVVQAENGTQFELTDDIDFTETDSAGNLLATITIGKRDNNNQPTTFILSQNELCISGFRAVETFNVGSFEPFLKLTLSHENVTDIISVVDGFGNEYYQVEHLTQGTIFKSTINRSIDNQLVKENLMIVAAPYRFISDASAQTRLTTLTFGAGAAETVDNDAVPDPSEYALPLYGKTNFSRFTLDPGNLLQSTTFGVVSSNTTITVVYRYGGGLSHNVPKNSIRGTTVLNMDFYNGPSVSNSQFVRASVDAVNDQHASGGDDPPTLDELKLKIPSVKASQGRIVTREDLLARIYTMPSNFGRIFRASVRSNPNNPLAAQLFIISRNQNQQLIVSPDSLKKNLATYINQYRMISDSIDILDAQVINLKLEFTIVVDPSNNKNIVIQNVLNRLKKYFDIKNFDIDQPLVISDINNIIYNNAGVISVQGIKIKNITGTISNRVYSDVQFDVDSNIIKGVLVPPSGGIFEFRFKDFDLSCSTT